jgi:hypothetical protein
MMTRSISFTAPRSTVSVPVFWLPWQAVSSSPSTAEDALPPNVELADLLRARFVPAGVPGQDESGVIQ